MVFVTDYKSTEVLQPCEKSLYFPPSAVPTQRSSVLGCGLLAIRFVRGDQIDASLDGQLFVKLVRVVRLVADHFLRQLVQYASVQGLVDQRHFMRASAACVDGDRKTFSVDKAHDFSAFPAFCLPNTGAPFFAGAKVPSMKPSLRSIPPRSRRSSAKAVSICTKTPCSVHCWSRRWQVLFGGYRSGKSFHGAPVRRIQRMPLSTSRGSAGGRPRRPGPLRGTGTYCEIRFHCSSVISIINASYKCII